MSFLVQYSSGYIKARSTRIVLRAKGIICIVPNRSLDHYSANRCGYDNFLASFIILLPSCSSFVLDVARYAFKLTKNHLLNNQTESVQDLMTDLGLWVTSFILCQSYTLLFHQFEGSTLWVRTVFIASFLSFNKKQWDGT